MPADPTSPASISHTASAWLVRRRVALLVIGCVLTLLAWPVSWRLEFDRSIENMFASDSPLLPPFRQLKRTFGGDEIVMVAYVDQRLLSTEGLARLDRLRKDLAAVPGVEATLSILDSPAQNAITSAFGAPLLEFFEGLLIGSDRQTTAVLCFLEREAVAKIPRDATINRLRETAEAFDPSAVIGGEPVLMAEGFRYLEQDGWLLGWATSILLMAVILFFFRSARWMLIPIVIVQAALIWTRALLVVGEFRLSMVSSMLTAIVTVIGIATVVHLIVRYREESAANRPPRDALLAAAAVLAAPIVWAIVTDVCGFLSLVKSSVGPVQSFGIMMALGAVATLFSVAIFLPGLALIGSFDRAPKDAFGESHLGRALKQLTNQMQRRPWLWTLLISVIVGAAVWGNAYLEVETDFTKNFRAGTPVVKSYQFLEQRLGGAGVWDVFVPAPKVFDAAFVDRVRDFEERLRDEVIVRRGGREEPGLTKVVSLVDAIDAASATTRLMMFVPLSTKFYSIKERVPQLWRALDGVDPVDQRHYFRIMLRSREQQTAAEKMAIIAQVHQIAEESFPGEARVTGFFVLLASLIDSLLADQWTTFALASIGIFLTIFAAFRNVTWATIALVPNALPIFMVLGGMGHLGYKVNMGTVMIAAVSMGLSVDSSIHYLNEFRRALASGLDFSAAIHRVHQSVGRAMVLSSIALMIGFLVLVLSHFIPTIYFGVLVSLSMLGGLLGNLVVLPLLLQGLHSLAPKRVEAAVGQAPRA